MVEARPGLFLDLDGTLADSLFVMKAVYGRFLQHFGKTASAEEFDRLNGPPLAKVVALLADRHGLTVPLDALTAFYWTLIEEAYAGVVPNPGAETLLQTALEHGWPVCIVTSNRAALARRWLDGRNLSRYVAAVIGSEDVTQGKPSAEPYLLALKATGCTAAGSLAVEDSPSGATAALAANLRTFLLTQNPPPPTLAAEPIPRLDSLCARLLPLGGATA